MEVTAAQFEAALPRVEAALASCDYVAIDCEFTGLSLYPSRKEEIFDDMEQRYARVRQSAQSFLIIQFGLCAVRWDATAQRYEAQTFNFYTFPRPYNGIDCRFTSQASSLDFLRHHNFDFNKFIYEGIPYLSLEQLAKEEQHLASGPSARDPIQLTQDGDRAFVGRQLARVQSWLESSPALSSSRISRDAPSLQSGGAATDSAPDSVPSSSIDLNVRPEAAAGASTGAEAAAPQGPGGEQLGMGEGDEPLVLEPANGFLRLALYQELDRIYGRQFFIAETVKVQGDDGVREAVQLTGASAAEVEEHTLAREEERRKKLREAAGFAYVMRALATCRKPVMGHNMLLDLAYMYHRFVGALPPNVEGFREKLLQLLPGGVVDTKHLAKQLPNMFPGGTSLGDVFATATRGTCPGPGNGGAGASGGLESSQAGGAPAATAEGGASGGAEAMNLDSEAGAGPADVTQPVLVHVNVAPDIADPSSAAAEVPVVLPPVVHAPGFDRYRDLPPGAGMAHEAGYDAFMTAAAFSGLAQMLGARATGGTAEAQDSVPEGKPFSWDAVLPHANKVNVMRSDMDHLPLLGPLATPDRSHVFLLSGLQPTGTTASVRACAASAGLGESRLFWLDGATAYLALQSGAVEADSEALEKLRAAFAPATVTPYSERASYSRRRDGGDVRPPAKLAKLSDGQPAASPPAVPAGDSTPPIVELGVPSALPVQEAKSVPKSERSPGCAVM